MATVSFIRAAMAQMVVEGARQRGLPVDPQDAERLGIVINALGNGLALEKLAAPEAVPDELFGDILVLIFGALVEQVDKA